MNQLLKIILSLSLSGTLLILILFLCKPFVKNRLSKRWQYYIWLIAVARLLFPFAPKINLMGTLFQHFDNAVIQTDESAKLEQDTLILPKTDFSDPYNTSDQIEKGEHSQSDKMQVLNVFDMAKQNSVVICLLIWLSVSGGLLIRKVTIYQSFVKYIKAGRVELSDMQLWEQAGKLVEQTRVKKAVGIYMNGLISSPLLIGFFRPCIMLPTTKLSDLDFQYIILHELTHYKRWDMFYKWLVQITICVHWFNPFVYFMCREIGRACELSCDEAVIRTLNARGRRAYGDTLLNAMGMGGTYKDSLVSITLNESTELLKERLDAIMRFQKKTKLTVVVSAALVCIMLFGASITGAYIFANEKATPPKYMSMPETQQTSTAQKTFDSIDEYAKFYNLKTQAVSALDVDIKDVISLVTVWPGTVTRREVGEGLYVEFWTRTEKRPTGRYVWSEILLTNGKDDDKQILLRLATPDFLITDGSISLPENAVGSVEGWAWSGFSISEQQKEGEITYIKTTFTATLTIGDTVQTITPICTMVSNAPKGNTYRVGLIHAVWNGKETKASIPVPQAPDTPNEPSTSTSELYAAPIDDPTYISSPIYNPQTIYSPDTNGVLTIPFSMKEIKKDTFVCLGQVPCMTKNADTISIQVHSESGNGIYVLVNEIDLSTKYKDYCFLDWCDNDTPGEINSSFNKLRDASYNNHTGNFYIYIGAKDGTDLADVSGTITIQTYTDK